MIFTESILYHLLPCWGGGGLVLLGLLQPTKPTTVEPSLCAINPITISAAPEPALVAANLPAKQLGSRLNLQLTKLAATEPARC